MFSRLIKLILFLSILYCIIATSTYTLEEIEHDLLDMELDEKELDKELKREEKLLKKVDKDYYKKDEKLIEKEIAREEKLLKKIADDLIKVKKKPKKKRRVKKKKIKRKKKPKKPVMDEDALAVYKGLRSGFSNIENQMNNKRKKYMSKERMIRDYINQFKKLKKNLTNPKMRYDSLKQIMELIAKLKNLDLIEGEFEQVFLPLIRGKAKFKKMEILQQNLPKLKATLENFKRNMKHFHEFTNKIRVNDIPPRIGQIINRLQEIKQESFERNVLTKFNKLKKIIEQVESSSTLRKWPMIDEWLKPLKEFVKEMKKIDEDHAPPKEEKPKPQPQQPQQPPQPQPQQQQQQQPNQVPLEHPDYYKAFLRNNYF